MIQLLKSAEVYEAMCSTLSASVRTSMPSRVVEVLTCCTRQYQAARFVDSECREHRHRRTCSDPIEVYHRTIPMQSEN